MSRIVGREAVAAAAVLALLAVAVWLASETLAGVRLVRGDSMRPALLPGDRVVVDLWTLRHRPPRPGEIVVLRRPGGDAPLVKRVRRTLPDGTVWVEGDHLASSDDSRRFGAVEPERIRGLVAWRYWPPSRFGRPGPETDPRR